MNNPAARFESTDMEAFASFIASDIGELARDEPADSPLSKAVTFLVQAELGQAYVADMYADFVERGDEDLIEPGEFETLDKTRQAINVGWRMIKEGDEDFIGLFSRMYKKTTDDEEYKERYAAMPEVIESDKREFYEDQRASLVGVAPIIARFR